MEPHVIPLGGGGSVAFSPDGELVAVASWKGEHGLFRTGSWQRVREAVMGPGQGVCFSPDGQVLVAYGSAVWWRRKDQGWASTSRYLSDPMRFGEAVFSLAGDLLALVTESPHQGHRVMVLRTGEEKVLHWLRLTSLTELQTCAFLQDGQQLVGVSAGLPSLWTFDLASGRREETLARGLRLGQSCLLPTGLHAAVVAAGEPAEPQSCVQVSRLVGLGEAPQVLERKALPGGRRWAVAVSPAERVVVALAGDEGLLWPLGQGASPARLELPGQAVAHALRSDDSLLATLCGLSPAVLTLWSLTSGRPVAQQALPRPVEPSARVKFSPGGQWLAVLTGREALLWEVARLLG